MRLFNGLRTVEKDYEALLKEIDDFGRFFSPRNFERLDEWGKHLGARQLLNFALNPLDRRTWKVHINWYGGAFDFEMPMNLAETLDRVAFIADSPVD